MAEHDRLLQVNLLRLFSVAHVLLGAGQALFTVEATGVCKPKRTGWTV